jgi:hypothetical protein
MRQNAEVAEQILQRLTVPAVRLDHLAEAVEQRSGASVGGHHVLLQELRARPDRFRILNPWIGPWRTAMRRHEGPGFLPWVIALRVPRTPRGPGCRSLVSMTESLRAIAARLDSDCPSSVARCLGLLVAGREVARHLHTSAENQAERHSSSASTDTSESPLPAAAA